MARSNTIFYKTSEEIEALQESNLIVSKTLGYLGSILKPGLTGKELDLKAEEFIRDHGAVPSFKGLYGCPSSILTSVNECVVHGLPTDRPFEETDIVSIDCGAYKNEFHGDSAFTFCFNGVSKEALDMVYATNDSLYLGISKARVGNKIGDISSAIQNHIEKKCGYAIVRELSGHGIGRTFHEAPEVSNYGRKGSGPVIKPGLVIAIEPMVNTKTRHIATLPDGWTIVAKDGRPTAHFEHSIVVKRSGPELLSNHKFAIESSLDNDSLASPAISKFAKEFEK